MIKPVIRRAYQVMRERNWDTIYWAIDLHGVCFPSNYQQGGYTFINDLALEGLLEISKRQENKIILWSCCHPEEHQAIIDFMASHGVKVAYFNENPEVTNTATGCFDRKFYSSIILDDKAGFDPDEDWREILYFYTAVDNAINYC